MHDPEKPIPWSGVLIVRNRRVLTVKETDKPFYVLPGGKVEPGESDQAAAVREVLEELAIQVHIQEPLIEIIEPSKNTGLLIRFKLFAATIKQDPDANNLPGKTEKFAWINSKYEKEGFEVGNFLIKLLPILAKRNIID